jgi:hypothetical protein
MAPDQKGWWRTHGLMLIVIAAGWTSSVVPAVGWKPAFLALGFAVFSADCAFGWIRTPGWRAAALTMTMVCSVVAAFAPRLPALIALLAVGAFWVLSFWKYSEPGVIRASVTRA